MKIRKRQTILLPILCLVIGILLIGFASIYQMVLMYEKFGFIISGDSLSILIPHWSALFYIPGVIFVGIGGWFLYLY